jgi:hypothetical protein
MNRTLQISIALAILLVGCATESITSTQKFYFPLSTRTYPPKPKDAKIPIIAAYPDRPYTAIGRMSFQSGHGWQWMLDAVRYNARLAGADAVVMDTANTTTHQYTYHVPGYTTYQPVTTYGNANYYGSGGSYGYATGTSTSYVPEYNPGYSGVGTVLVEHANAVMIKFQ